MSRTAITNGSGSWFDSEKAELFKQKTRHDGSNWISKATGTQFNHEGLYLTKGGKWILNQYSSFAGTVDTYEVISAEEAAEWFAKQEFTDEEIPESLHEIVSKFEIE